MSLPRTEKGPSLASRARRAHEPAAAEACPDCLRWRSARRFTAHLLMFLCGLATLAALVREPTLQESAGALLAMWGAGLSLWGFLVLLERRSHRAPHESARASKR